MNSMKPYKTLLILLVFLVFLFGPSFFIEGPVRIASGLSIRFPSPPSDITRLISSRRVITAVDTSTVNCTDSLPQTGSQTVSEVSDSLPAQGRDFIPVEFADSSSVWQSLLDSIISGSGQTRILYYGDSQLEGDRITDLLRSEMRKYRGGTGPGLLSPTMLVQYTRTVYLRSSSNWRRYNFLSYRSGEISHRDLGPMMSISRFTSPVDSTASLQKAWIKISPSIYADTLSRIYDSLRIFYGKLDDTLVISVSGKNRRICTDTLYPFAGIREYVANVEREREITIGMEGISSPDIYGISVESGKGLVVDNIPSRGSAGLEFTLVDRQSLSALYGLLDPDLVILHYGLNVVLNIRDSYSYYENAIFRQLSLLKSMLPGTAILVIGVTDMARQEGEEYHSFPNIPLISAAQRRAAERAGVMFWDSREAMGGADAIVSWKNNIPPLAADDYTHLSYEGGHILANRLIEGMLAGREMADYSLAAYVSDTVEIPADQAANAFLPLQGDENMTGEPGLWSRLKAYNPSQPLIFTGLSFWLFMLALLTGYSVIFSKPVLRNCYLFLFSLFFYYKSGGLFFILLVISTLTDYIAAWLIYITGRRFFKRVFLFISLFVNLGMLAYFKYAAFLTGVVNDLLNTDIPVYDWLAVISNNNLGTSFNINNIILPVGISFFTFQTISYTMDVYRGRVKPVRNILDFGFYVSFFPQLVAGPIVRASEFIPQLYAKFSLTRREWGHALFLILSGLVKKVIISDYISVNLIDRVFANPEIFSGFENLVSVYGYGLQIYCDFSGYTDIAIGVALMLGYRLPLNFNSPYKAGSITDFWRRWHISLSRWLRDYLYISLGGNRKGVVRTNINILVTMLLGGLWHGAAWRFVLWGGLHGFGLIIHKLWIRIAGGRGEKSRLWRFLSIFITFNFVSFCWIFFRAGSMTGARALISQVLWSFSPGEWIDVLKTYSQVFTIIVAGYILHFLPTTVKESYRGLFIRLPLVVKMVVVYIIALALFNIQSADIQPFIYFRF